MEPTTLSTDRLVLRPFTAADEDEVYAAAQDADIQRWTVVPSPYGHADAHAFVNEIAPTGWREGTAMPFAVRLGARGPLVASVGVHVRGTGGFASHEIGYWATKEHRGHGYMTEAVLAVARWAFTELGVARLEWRAEVGNAGSAPWPRRPASGSRASCGPASSSAAPPATAGSAPCSPPTWACPRDCPTCPLSVVRPSLLG